MPKCAYTEEDKARFAAERAAKKNELTETVTTMIEAMTQPEPWAQVMAAAAVHWDRGPVNCIALAAQAPQARWVRSFAAWRRDGRPVCKGERGVRICLPCTSLTPEDEQEQHSDGREDRVRRWSTGVVFDIAQTDGAELEIPHPYERPVSVVLDALTALGTEHGLTAEMVDEPESTCRRLLAEIAECLLPYQGQLPEARAAEAASAAHVAARMLGIPPGPTPVPPVDAMEDEDDATDLYGWLAVGNDLPPIRRAAVRAIRTARELADSVVGLAAPSIPAPRQP